MDHVNTLLALWEATRDLLGPRTLDDDSTHVTVNYDAGIMMKAFAQNTRLRPGQPLLAALVPELPCVKHMETNIPKNRATIHQ